MWSIGDIEIKNRVVLAPMAGVSNPSYMKICEEMGAGYAITELISSEAIVRENKKTFDMLNGIDKLDMPVAVQIFGSEPEVMARGAKRICEMYQIDIIDINIGCPVPKVAQRAGAGSGLLREPEKVYEIVKAVSDAVLVPVTVKIRSGWDSASINATLIAKMCEKAGAAAIAIHPRTRSQGYTGEADWNIIRDVKESVDIPVIGNGDIKSKEDAKRMFDETGCDAVMIGRAAIGNPWIIRDTVKFLEDGVCLKKPTLKEKVEMIKRHLDYLMDNTLERVAVMEMRMHVSHYLKGMPNSKEIKERIFKVVTRADFNRVLDDYLESVS